MWPRGGGSFPVLLRRARGGGGDRPRPRPSSATRRRRRPRSPSTVRWLQVRRERRGNSCSSVVLVTATEIPRPKGRASRLDGPWAPGEDKGRVTQPIPRTRTRPCPRSPTSWAFRPSTPRTLFSLFPFRSTRGPGEHRTLFPDSARAPASAPVHCHVPPQRLIRARRRSRLVSPRPEAPLAHTESRVRGVG